MAIPAHLRCYHGAAAPIQEIPAAVEDKEALSHAASWIAKGPQGGLFHLFLEAGLIDSKGRCRIDPSLPLPALNNEEVEKIEDYLNKTTFNLRSLPIPSTSTNSPALQYIREHNNGKNIEQTSEGIILKLDSFTLKELVEGLAEKKHPKPLVKLQLVGGLVPKLLGRSYYIRALESIGQGELAKKIPETVWCEIEQKEGDCGLRLVLGENLSIEEFKEAEGPTIDFLFEHAGVAEKNEHFENLRNCYRHLIEKHSLRKRHYNETISIAALSDGNDIDIIRLSSHTPLLIFLRHSLSIELKTANGPHSCLAIAPDCGSGWEGLIARLLRQAVPPIFKVGNHFEPAPTTAQFWLKELLFVTKGDNLFEAMPLPPAISPEALCNEIERLCRGNQLAAKALLFNATVELLPYWGENELRQLWEQFSFKGNKKSDPVIFFKTYSRIVNRKRPVQEAFALAELFALLQAERYSTEFTGRGGDPSLKLPHRKNGKEYSFLLPFAPDKALSQLEGTNIDPELLECETQEFPSLEDERERLDLAPFELKVSSLLRTPGGPRQVAFNLLPRCSASEQLTHTLLSLLPELIQEKKHVDKALSHLKKASLEIEESLPLFPQLLRQLLSRGNLLAMAHSSYWPRCRNESNWMEIARPLLTALAGNKETHARYCQLLDELLKRPQLSQKERIPLIREAQERPELLAMQTAAEKRQFDAASKQVPKETHRTMEKTEKEPKPSATAAPKKAEKRTPPPKPLPAPAPLTPLERYSALLQKGIPEALVPEVKAFLLSKPPELKGQKLCRFLKALKAAGQPLEAKPFVEQAAKECDYATFFALIKEHPALGLSFEEANETVAQLLKSPLEKMVEAELLDFLKLYPAALERHWPQLKESIATPKAKSELKALFFNYLVETSPSPRLQAMRNEFIQEIDTLDKLASFIDTATKYGSQNPSLVTLVCQCLVEKSDFTEDSKLYPRLTAWIKGSTAKDLLRDKEEFLLFFNLLANYASPEIDLAILNRWGNSFLRDIDSWKPELQQQTVAYHWLDRLIVRRLLKETQAILNHKNFPLLIPLEGQRVVLHDAWLVGKINSSKTGQEYQEVYDQWLLSFPHLILSAAYMLKSGELAMNALFRADNYLRSINELPGKLEKMAENKLIPLNVLSPLVFATCNSILKLINQTKTSSERGDLFYTYVFRTLENAIAENDRQNPNVNERIADTLVAFAELVYHGAAGAKSYQNHLDRADELVSKSQLFLSQEQLLANDATITYQHYYSCKLLFLLGQPDKAASLLASGERPISVAAQDSSNIILLKMINSRHIPVYFKALTLILAISDNNSALRKTYVNKVKELIFAIALAPSDIVYLDGAFLRVDHALTKLLLALYQGNRYTHELRDEHRNTFRAFIEGLITAYNASPSFMWLVSCCTFLKALTEISPFPLDYEDYFIAAKLLYPRLLALEKGNKLVQQAIKDLIEDPQFARLESDPERSAKIKELICQCKT